MHSYDPMHPLPEDREMEALYEGDLYFSVLSKKSYTLCVYTKNKTLL